MPAIRIYGIANCDKVRKARSWFEKNGVSAGFHDFRKDGLPPALLRRWLAQHDWSELLNRAGTTWRKLPEKRRATVVSKAAAEALMLEFPTLIKRPVIETGDRVSVGFDARDHAHD